MRLRLSIALASALWASLAVADGYSRPGTTYAAPPLLSWTGFYVGAHLGGAWSDVEWANVTWTGERVTNNSSGFFGGAQMGYNQQFGNIVLGVETTLSGGSLSRSFRSVVDPAAVTYNTVDNTIVTVTGRLGWPVTNGCSTPRRDGRVRKSTYQDVTRRYPTGFPSTIGAMVGLSAAALSIRSAVISVLALNTASSIWVVKASQV